MDKQSETRPIVLCDRSENTMRAANRIQYCSPGALAVKDVDQLTFGDDELLVRVRATTVNRTDCAVLTGKPFIMRFFTGLMRPKRAITGTDFSGEVVEIGKQVSDFNVGDHVWGFHDEGLSSHAEYLAAGSRTNVALMPKGITFAQAAASLEGAHYAFNFFKRLNLQPGQCVLVNGTTGAIGSALVQFLKAEGIAVTAVCDTQRMDLVRSLGADTIIDYENDDFTKTEQQYDVVLDAVGKSTFAKCKRLLKPGGVYSSSELGPYCQNPLLAVVTPWFGGRKVRFPLPTSISDSMAYIHAKIEADQFRPLIDREYPLEEIADAFRYVMRGQKTGNVILVPET